MKSTESDKRRIAVFRTGLLPPTQTFIPAQMGALHEFTPFYVGLDRITDGRTLGAQSVILMDKRSLPARVNKAFYKMTGSSPSFNRRIRDLRPVLVHAHFILDGVYAMHVAEHLKIPLLVTLHAHVPTSFGRKLAGASLDSILFSLRLRKLWKRASVFICVSDFVRREALQMGYPSEKLRVHYIGVDRSVFVRSDLPRDPRLVVFVGRLRERKGVPYLLKAMREVQNEIPDARVAIIGTGDDKPTLERQAKDLRINVEFLGGLSDPEMRAQLAKAKIFAAPSITAADGDAEALGMVFAEAQATGLPVVSCFHGGVPEVVRHGETGLLAPEKDSRTLATHIRRLLTDEPFWQACSDNGVRWIQKRFDLAQQTRELEQLYCSVLCKHHAE